MYKDILLPIDLSSESSWDIALPVAIEYCQKFGSRLHVLTVVPNFGMSIVGNFFPDDFEAKAIQETNTKLHKFVSENIPKDVKVQHIVGHGTVYSEILSISEEVKCDLIIMSSDSPELKDYLLGPNAARVVRHSDRSVLVVRDKK